uniref:Uncharacterized protein n=1 Tax=Cacopsylla melanoneura TaxID=428564 RepID=A0A8D8XF50_9HEMI
MIATAPMVADARSVMISLATSSLIAPIAAPIMIVAIATMIVLPATAVSRSQMVGAGTIQTAVVEIVAITIGERGLSRGRRRGVLQVVQSLSRSALTGLGPLHCA